MTRRMSGQEMITRGPKKPMLKRITKARMRAVHTSNFLAKKLKNSAILMGKIRMMILVRKAFSRLHSTRLSLILSSVTPS